MHYYLLHLKMFVLNLFWKGQFISGGQRKMDGNRKLIQVKTDEIELHICDLKSGSSNSEGYVFDKKIQTIT